MDTEGSTAAWFKSGLPSNNIEQQIKHSKLQSPSSSNENTNKGPPSSSTVNIATANNVVALLNQINGSKVALTSGNSINTVNKHNDNNEHLTTVIPVTTLDSHHAIITNTNSIDFYSIQNNTHSLSQQQTQQHSMDQHIHNHSIQQQRDNDTEDNNESSTIELNQNNSSTCSISIPARNLFFFFLF